MFEEMAEMLAERMAEHQAIKSEGDDIFRASGGDVAMSNLESALEAYPYLSAYVFKASDDFVRAQMDAKADAYSFVEHLPASVSAAFHEFIASFFRSAAMISEGDAKRATEEKPKETNQE